jgi:hypothetical protein
VKKFIALLKTFFGWLGTVVTTGVGGALSTGIVAAVVLLIKRNWAVDAWHAIARAWHWLGRDIALPHWLFLLLLAAAVVVLMRAGLSIRARRQRSAINPGAVAYADAWRAALVRLTDTFLARRAEAFDEGVPLEQDWLIEYRELRRETIDAYSPIAPAFRKWIRGIPPEYLGEYRDEPTWFDIDSGPDETPDGLVEKLWMPLSFPEAVGFWNEWEHRKLQRLCAERIDLVDSFIRHLRNPISPRASSPSRCGFECDGGSDGSGAGFKARTKHAATPREPGEDREWFECAGLFDRVWQDGGTIVAVKPREAFLRYFQTADKLARRREKKRGVKSGSDGTRTRDLRRDRPLRGSQRERRWLRDPSIHAGSRALGVARPHG